MSEKMIEVKGKQVSEDTIAEALKNYCHTLDSFRENAPDEEEKVKVPILSIAGDSSSSSVAIIRLSNEIFNSIYDCLYGLDSDNSNDTITIVIDQDGSVIDVSPELTEDFEGQYKNISPIFGNYVITKTKSK